MKYKNKIFASPIDINKTLWKDAKNANIISFDVLLKMFLTADEHIILIEGIRAFSISALMNVIGKETSLKVFTTEDICEHFLYHFTGCGQEIKRESAGTLIVFKDIDLLTRNTAVQIEAAILVRNLAKEAKIILSGIHCRKRIPLLMEQIQQPVHIFRFAGTNDL